MQAVFVYKYTFLCYRPSMGRPKLPPEQRRSEVFAVRFTKAELGRIERAAKKAKLDPKDWARNCLIEHSTDANIRS